MYKAVQGQRGTRWMKDGRFIKAEDVPQEEIDKLKGSVVEQPALPNEKRCIFCGAPTKLSRFVDLQTVPICQDHYYSETIGKVAQKLRSL